MMPFVIQESVKYLKALLLFVAAVSVFIMFMSGTLLLSWLGGGALDTQFFLVYLELINKVYYLII